MVRWGEHHYIVAKDRIEFLKEKISTEGVTPNEGDGEILATINGNLLEHTVCQHPLFESRLSPILLATHVTTTAGTGLVHTAPGIIT